MKKLLPLFFLSSLSFASGYFGNGGAGAPTIGSSVVNGTDNALLFVDPVGTLAEDPLLLNYDKSNGRLCLGCPTPSATFHLLGTARFQSLGAGLAHLDSSGVLSSSTLVNADVNAAAAIAVSKLAALTVSRALVSDGSGVISPATTTSTEIGYVNGVTSSIQTQLDAKEPTQTKGSISTSTTGVSVGSGSNSTVGPNVTVNVQTASGSQPGLISSTDWTTFNGKQDGDSDLTAVAGLSATGLVARTGTGTASARTVTGTANRITVTNGDGVSGNPTLDIGANVATLAGSEVLTNKTISGASNTISNINLGSQVTSTLPIANGGTGQTAATAAFNGLDPLTTKGDVIVHNGTDSVRQAVGLNGAVLTADSAQTNGLKWLAPATIVGMALITGGNPTRTTASYGALGSDASVTGPSVVYQGPMGTISTTDTNFIKFTFASLPSGTYKVDMTFTATQSNSDYMAFAISDGTNTRGQVATAPGVNVYVPFHISAIFNYTSTASQTFELFAYTASGTTTVINSPSFGGTNIIVTYFPN